MQAQLESANLFMSDLHCGKKTDLFNPQVLVRQLEQTAEKAERIRELLSAYDFDRLTVWCGGDANDGTQIYAEQATEQAETNVEAQADALADELERFLLRLKKTWKEVVFEAVPGNHGRTGKGAHVAANWDLVCFNYLRRSLKDKGIPVNYQSTGTGAFLRTVDVRGHRFLLYHGHHIRTFGNIPWYGLQLRVSRWLSTRKIGRFDVALIGHFHTLGSWQINSVKILLTGTAVVDDDWSLIQLGYEPAAVWHMFGTSNKYPITWSFPIDLEIGEQHGA